MILFALTSAPAAEPVSAADFRAYARLDDGGDEAVITRMLKDARKLCEAFTRRAFITQTWTATLDRWPTVLAEDSGDGWPFYTALSRRRVRLSPTPLASISSVIVDGVTIASTNYRLAGDEIVVKGEVTDSTDELGGGIVITFVAGYGASSASVPEPILDAILAQAGEMYEQRELSSDTMRQACGPGVTARLAPYVAMRELTP